jgi:hypothetical protein
MKHQILTCTPQQILPLELKQASFVSQVIDSNTWHLYSYGKKATSVLRYQTTRAIQYELQAISIALTNWHHRQPDERTATGAARDTYLNDFKAVAADRILTQYQP